MVRELQIEIFAEIIRPKPGEPMNPFIIAAIIAASSIGHAADSVPAPTFTVKKPDMSKIDAVKLLLKNPGAEVYRCSAVLLTEKMTIKNKKAVK